MDPNIPKRLGGQAILPTHPWAFFSRGFSPFLAKTPSWLWIRSGRRWTHNINNNNNNRTGIGKLVPGLDRDDGVTGIIGKAGRGEGGGGLSGLRNAAFFFPAPFFCSEPVEATAKGVGNLGPLAGTRPRPGRGTAAPLRPPVICYLSCLPFCMYRRRDGPWL